MNPSLILGTSTLPEWGATSACLATHAEHVITFSVACVFVCSSNDCILPLFGTATDTYPHTLVSLRDCGDMWVSCLPLAPHTHTQWGTHAVFLSQLFSGRQQALHTTPSLPGCLCTHGSSFACLWHFEVVLTTTPLSPRPQHVSPRAVPVVFVLFTNTVHATAPSCHPCGCVTCDTTQSGDNTCGGVTTGCFWNQMMGFCRPGQDRGFALGGATQSPRKTRGNKESGKEEDIYPNPVSNSNDRHVSIVDCLLAPVSWRVRGEPSCCYIHTHL